MAFPTITYKSVEVTPEENSIASNPQDGKVIVRRKFTKTRRTFKVGVTKLKDAQYAPLLAHYNSVETTLSFLWTNPLEPLTPITVRFKSPLVGKKSAIFPDHYDVNDLTLVEV